MTDTSDITPSTEPAAARDPGRRWKLVAGLAAAVGVLAVGVAAFAISRNDNDDQGLATEQIAVTRRACEQWLDDNSQAGYGPGRGWRNQMTSWMASHMADGQPMMGGPMMWDNPQAMRGWCTQAMGCGRTSIDDPTRWCDQMVDWMSNQMGHWDNWDHHWDN